MLLIVYGYTTGSNVKALIGQYAIESSNIVDVKPFDNQEGKIIFAALIDHSKPYFPTPTTMNDGETHFVIQRANVQTLSAKRGPQFNVAFNQLNEKQRKRYFRNLRKTEPLSKSNWKLHISRNRALNWVGEYLHTHFCHKAGRFPQCVHCREMCTMIKQKQTNPEGNIAFVQS